MAETVCASFTPHINIHTHVVVVFFCRVAKRKLDDNSFLGGVLHVCYAPEYETVQDTREKLQQRRIDVARRVRKLGWFVQYSYCKKLFLFSLNVLSVQ